MKKLEQLTKEDLILVIAEMHDTIQEWNSGYGLDKETGDVLVEVGRMCVNETVKIHGHNWDISGILEDKH